jgi:GH43 family beta-xylosidase
MANDKWLMTDKKGITKIPDQSHPVLFHSISHPPSAIRHFRFRIAFEPVTMRRSLPVLLCLLLAPRPALAGPLADLATFTNPIGTGADPWVVRHDGHYYLSQSRGGTSIMVSRSDRLEEITRGRWARVWNPPAGLPARELWAPELHLLRGKWYIYVAADDGENRNHRMIVLEGTTPDPQGPFIFKGRLAATTDRWAIDGTVLEMPGDRLYFLWSGWEGTENVAQNLYIAPMSNPWTIQGERVCISRPEFDWEKHGKPLINEGPEVLRHGGRLFLIYSASGSWGDDYGLGRLDWTGGDPLRTQSWVKHPSPLFARTPDVFGPGHCSFTTSPDGREDWIVYHAARRAGSGWDRNIRIQPFTWNPDGTPNLGRPVSPGVPLTVPSGEASQADRQAKSVMGVPSGSVSRVSR